MEAVLLKIKSVCQFRSHNDSQKPLENDNNGKRFDRIVLYDLVLLLALFVIVPVVVFVLFYLTKNSKVLTAYSLTDESISNTNRTLSADNITNSANRENREFASMSNHTFAMHTNDERKLKRFRSMRRYHLSDSDMVCNDGSSAGYYLRKSLNSTKNWIVVLEGGNFCYDNLTCQSRRQNNMDLTSSKNWKMFRNGSGILSSKKSENKYWWDSNTVLIPYCSSDLWIGNKNSNNRDTGFSFMGRQILLSVFDDLIDQHQMADANQIVLTGLSAGGIGVIMNIDEIEESLKTRVPHANVRGVIDSSWLLEIPCDHNSRINCSIADFFYKTVKYWNASIPLKYLVPFEKPWNSLMPSKLYSLIRTPIFIVQSLFDESQLIEQIQVLSVKNPKHNHPVLRFTRAIRMLKTKMIKSLRNTQAVFAPSCTTHMILTNRHWDRIEIENRYLVDVLYDWLNGKNANKEHRSDHLIDSKCDWPNCNKACPNPIYPLNNKETDIIQLFNFYGVLSEIDLALHLNIEVKDLSTYKYEDLMDNLLSRNGRIK